ncbi:putative glycosyl hydrolases family 16 [Lyophyllum shimeji]|uniref:Glycosyl hydrolases family 16 n=1 Tax=Lyophyllum shimeji TaxID=47721 RepID=A0A9P3PWE0_LYOSH|nr:putative glycosyl hydrolases family 16 [Lyophyllum shimeji]
MSKPAPINVQHDSEQLSPPQPQFVVEAAPDGDSERQSTSHSRSTSGAVSYADSPPITPRSLTFGSPINPFSPPESIISFGSSALDTPAQTPGQHAHHGSHSHFPFSDATPRSGVASRATSMADLSRMSSGYYSSRPSTADFGSNRGSSTRLREAFTSPPTRPLTMMSVAPASKLERPRPKSTMLSAKGALEKPWLTERDPYSKIAYLLTYAIMFLGMALGAIRCWTGWEGVPLIKDKLCLVMDENFQSEDGIFGDNGKFFREVDMSGFGNGEFEMTTASRNNSFVKDGRLYIVPTLTSDNLGEAAIEDGYVYNITGCTFNITRGAAYTDPTRPSTMNISNIALDDSFDLPGYLKACSAVSNATAGQIINPVQSARISTRRSSSIKYGKVEVRAKIPRGDWLWPAIWMLPVDNKYGPWPMSGEIDIMEARGNGPRYPRQGTDWVRGSLNWGPLTWLNGVAKTYGAWHLRRGSHDTDFHTYGLEWTEEFIRIYVDSRLHHMMPVLKLDKQSFWERGDFPPVVQNGSETVILNNPWINGTKAAPFDQPFYLIMNVAVGGTNGWFPDSSGDKPWLDGSRTAMADFWKNRHKWLPSWPTNVEDRALVVDSVKMWQKC